MKLLLGISGAIAAAYMPSYITYFYASGVTEIRVILSHSASRMVAPEALSHLCDELVGPNESRNHIELARWCEVFAIAPASAHTLGLVANGLAGNLIAGVALGCGRGVIVAPAMNVAMWETPAVQRNVAALRGDGHTVLDPSRREVYEVASKSMVDSLAFPSPQTILEAAQRHLDVVAGPHGR